MDDEAYLAEAFRLAARGHAGGGCPIGGVLVDNDSGDARQEREAKPAGDGRHGGFLH